jgi:DNA-binding NtrC family response regulator
MTILIVDDEVEVLRSLRTALEMEGWDVETRDRGSEAIEFFEEEGAEIVLLDINMPEVSGLELLKSIHEIDPTTEIVMITGFNSLDKAIDARELGASEYLLKPFEDTEQLLTIVEQAAGRIDRWQKAMNDALRQRRQADQDDSSET